MKKILLLLVAPCVFLSALSAQVTQQDADAIVLGRLDKTKDVTLYAAKGDVLSVKTIKGEELELAYACWAYYIRYSGKTGQYVMVKKSDGNLLEILPKNNDTGPNNLTEWRVVYPVSLGAISNKTWKTDKIGDIQQEWSDYLAYPADKPSSWGVAMVDEGTEGDGFYMKHPDKQYYMYNWYYVVQNQDKLCPSPWRVPTKQDIINLDLSLGGLAVYNTVVTTTSRNNPYRQVFMGIQSGNDWGHLGGTTSELEDADIADHVEKYVNKMGFDFSGRLQQGGNIDGAGTMGYVYTSQEAAEDAMASSVPGEWKGSQLCIKRSETSAGWCVFPQNEYDTSMDKARGLPVRCVKDVK